MQLTKYCTEQRAIWWKAENVAMKQFPSIVLNIVIVNVVIFISARHIVSTEVIVDNTSLLEKNQQQTSQFARHYNTISTSLNTAAGLSAHAFYQD